MRQVFSSARLENVERVATLLREAGIEVRITDGRSYKGNRRSTASYRERDPQQPAAWVVNSNDQARARELLRDAGLFESTRPGAGAKLSFTSQFGDESTRTPAQKRAARIKLALLGGILIVMTMMFLRGGKPPAAADTAMPPFNGHVAATLLPVAQAVFQHELADIDMPVACLGVDHRDAPLDVMKELRPRAGQHLVPASHCQRIADEERGSVHPATQQKATMVDVENFRPSAPDAGTVEYTAYHHRMWAKYKTFEVRRVGGRWQVTRTVKVATS